MHRIAIFASGDGNNAQRFIDYFKINRTAQISLIVTNNPQARVIERAKKAGIPCLLIDRETFYHSEQVVADLKQRIDFIVLAGFIWKIPKNIIHAYPNKIVNTHPSLLPRYGGKGMHGFNVHEAVLKNKEKKSGVTIHYVNENYDEGKIIFQQEYPVAADDTPQSMAEKVHQLEYGNYPVVVEKLLLNS